MSPSDPQFDAEQDAQLRAAPVPDGLSGRLRTAVLADDEGLDAWINKVAVPPGLCDRVRKGVLGEETALDAALRDVPMPADLAQGLWRRKALGRRLAGLGRWAIAVSLLLAIGVSYVGAMLVFLAGTYPDDDGLLPKLHTALSRSTADRSEDTSPSLSLAIPPRTEEVADVATFDAVPRVPQIKLFPFAHGEARPSNGTVLSLGPLGVDLLSKPYGRSEDVEATHRAFDALPELKKVQGLTPRGIDPPRVPGFNWPFYFAYGVFPPVYPVAHPALQTSLAPLGIDTSSYELTRRYLEDRELPPPEDIRIEEFLAAVDYKFPRPVEQGLELSTAGGPSPFGGPGTLLLQIGVQARDLPAAEHPATHLIVAVDVSASMRWGGRLEMTRRALGQLIEQLGPEDRLSLVSFSERAHALIENAGPADAESWLTAAKSLEVEDSTNLGAGLRRAYAVARGSESAGRMRHCVVLLTDGLTELGRSATDSIERQLAQAASEGLALEVIDLGQDETIDAQLTGFAQAGAGKVRRAGNAEEVGWGLTEILTGRSQLMAEEARLKVTFRPDVVLAYRLLGHEAESVAGLMPARPEADFHAGRSATAVYELQLRPEGGSEVALVELSWRPPSESASITRRVSVQRSTFAPSFAKSPSSLQAAAIVAETAEILSRSPFAFLPENSRATALSQVRRLAAILPTELRHRPSFAEFLAVVEQAERAKQYRRGRTPD